MKDYLRFRIWISVIGISLICGCTTIHETPLEGLRSLGKQMQKNQQVSYAYQINSYSSYADDTSRNEGVMYFEVNPADTSLGFRFEHESEYNSSFYNGAQMVQLGKRDSFADLRPLCNYSDGHMTVYPYLELSYAAIQNFLTDSLFAAGTDSISRKDTIVDHMRCKSYTFWIDSKIADTYKLPRHEGRKKANLVVNVQDHLPVLYSQYQSLPNNNYYYMEAYFKSYSFKKRIPEHEFSIEKVPAYYSWDKYKSIYQTLELESNAPDWELPVVFGGNVSLTDFHGRYLLLDFWFIGCGACVESIPTLNALQEKYGENSFEVLGINCYSNNLEKIEKYCIECNMHYRNVWNGESICDDYLIKAAPIFYLIDKDGKVAYTQIGHDEEKLISSIEEVLNSSQ